MVEHEAKKSENQSITLNDNKILKRLRLEIDGLFLPITPPVGSSKSIFSIVFWGTLSLSINIFIGILMFLALISLFLPIMILDAIFGNKDQRRP